MRQRAKGLIIFGIVLAVAVVLRIWQGYQDEDRVRNFVQSRGGKLLSMRWAPLGPGWLTAGKRTRIYQISYVDSGGATHQGYCRTSSSEVFLDDDAPEEPEK